MTESQIRASKQRNQEYRELIFDAKAEIITLIIALSYIFSWFLQMSSIYKIQFSHLHNCFHRLYIFSQILF